MMNINKIKVGTVYEGPKGLRRKVVAYDGYEVGYVPLNGRDEGKHAKCWHTTFAGWARKEVPHEDD